MTLMALTLGGCATGSYPDDWPSWQPSGPECPDIGGTYSNLGLASNPKARCGDPSANDPFCRLHSALYIADIFDSPNLADLIATTRVRIQKPASDSFQFAALAADGSVIYSRTVSTTDGEFTCDRDGAVFRTGWKGYGGDTMGAAGAGTRVFIFGKLSDGSLVLRKREGEAGALVVVPYAGTKNDWYRWLPAVGR